ncbi:MAG: hypothetical protein KAU48_00075 [Candidatus Thorarchaeota archaeon]|nr:hypothetical protein [Candidatus Thorarchaeota archaeon]
MAEVYNQATPESTYFNQLSFVLLLAFALIVTILFIRYKLDSGKSVATNK